MSTATAKVTKKKSYFDMVKEALVALQAPRSGVSRHPIIKYIIETYQLDEKVVNKHVKSALKEAVEAGKIIQVTGVGATGSFKLSSDLKKEEQKAAKAAEKKVDKENAEPVVKKTKTAVKKPAAKATAADQEDAEEVAAPTGFKKPLVKVAANKKAAAKNDEPLAKDAKTTVKSKEGKEKPVKASGSTKKSAAVKGNNLILSGSETEEPATKIDKAQAASKKAPAGKKAPAAKKAPVAKKAPAKNVPVEAEQPESEDEAIPPVKEKKN